MPEPLFFYRRGSAAKEEEIILGGGLMRWAYQNRVGKSLSGFLFNHTWPSRLAGWFANTRTSRRQITPVIRDLGIDASEFADTAESFPTFNAFFSRHLKPGARPFAPAPEEIAAPADGRVLVHPRLRKEAVIPVKGKPFTADALLGRPAAEYYDGSLAIVRLCPADYHRFHFPCDSRIIEQQRIKGRYHSVNQAVLALGIDVFGENERQVAILENDLLGQFAYVEVGAFGVGGIVQTYAGPSVRKGSEKGYFQYGGSTIVLLFQPGRIQFAEDLAAHSAEGYETFLKAGEVLAKAVVARMAGQS
jgi:phosphatidylserine decarboxylase